MKNFLALLAIGMFAMAHGTAQAQEKAKTPQQNKMAMCNKQAVGKTGDERKGFMKTCLSAKKEAQSAKG